METTPRKKIIRPWLDRWSPSRREKEPVPELMQTLTQTLELLDEQLFKRKTTESLVKLVRKDNQSIQLLCAHNLALDIQNTLHYCQDLPAYHTTGNESAPIIDKYFEETFYLLVDQQIDEQKIQDMVNEMLGDFFDTLQLNSTAQKAKTTRPPAYHQPYVALYHDLKHIENYYQTTTIDVNDLAKDLFLIFNRYFALVKPLLKKNNISN